MDVEERYVCMLGIIAGTTAWSFLNSGICEMDIKVGGFFADF